MTSHQDTRIETAGLAVLIILQVLMLGSLYTLTEPHPPVAIPPFALAPFLSASIALAAAALILGPIDTRLGRTTTLCAVITALVSFGPQKWLDPSITQIWPAVGLAQITCAILIGRAIARCLRGRDKTSAARPVAGATGS